MAYMTMQLVVMMLPMMLRSKQMLNHSGACQSRDNKSLCGLLQTSHELFRFQQEFMFWRQRCLPYTNCFPRKRQRLMRLTTFEMVNT